MAGDPKARRWVFYSLAILFAFSVSFTVSVSGQGTRAFVESLYHGVEIQYSVSMAEEMGHEPRSLQAERASAPAGPLSAAQGDAAAGKPNDLTAFFVIGFIINILLIGAFLYWAVGQWRKTK